ncbi:MAG: Cof-type HAD-IIB family hydrolase [Lachnospiraceae bacterium]|nr:Cof-type HAD-IIB family hydrolase [Lachnospiraceae bacterium]
MKYKLICIDIDGTLLDDQKRILPQVKESIRKVAAKGVHIVLASGRMPAGVESVEKELGVKCIKACNAGTYILLNDECIGAEYLSLETMKSVYTDIAEKYKIPLWIFCGRAWCVTGTDQYVEREIHVIGREPVFTDVASLAGKWAYENIRPNKLLVAAEPQKIQKIYSEMKEHNWEDIDMACSADDFIEIFPKGVTKGRALAVICNKLGINIEETVAFGDQELDIPMIEAAGTGIAMENAIKELKDKADFVTKSNNEAGIAYAIENYLERGE